MRQSSALKALAQRQASVKLWLMWYFSSGAAYGGSTTLYKSPKLSTSASTRRGSASFPRTAARTPNPAASEASAPTIRKNRVRKPPMRRVVASSASVPSTASPATVSVSSHSAAPSDMPRLSRPAPSYCGVSVTR